MLAAMAESYGLEQFMGESLAFIAKQKWELGVFFDRECRQKKELLKDKADVLLPEAHQP